MGKPKQPRNNPFADASNGVKMYTKGVCCDSLLAVYSYEVQGEGNNVIFTPLTGNDSADLKYYRWTIYDIFGNSVGGVLDLNAPTAAVNVLTNTLSTSGAWVVKFAAATDAASLSYSTNINQILSNPTGTSTPANYENVIFVLKLTSTDDLNFSFPDTEIKNGGEIFLEDFKTVGTQLNNAGSYIFSLEAKRNYYNPSANLPTNPTGNVILSAVAEPIYPILLNAAGVQIWNTITIKTTVAGIYKEVINVSLNNEDIQPSVYFTIKTNVA
jgi:hypothetical protein